MTQNAHQPSTPTHSSPGICLGCGRDLYRELRSGRGPTVQLYRDTVAESVVCPAAEAARFDAEAIEARSSQHWLADQSMRPGAYDPADPVDGEWEEPIGDSPETISDQNFDYMKGLR